MLMRAIQTLIACCCLAAWLCLAGLGARASHAGENGHPLVVAFSFDRPINAAQAPVVVAMTDGLFASEGLSVITSMAAGSPEAIARVASGASEFAIVDLNALIRFRSRASPPVKVPSSRLTRRPIVALEGRALRKRH